MDVKPFAPETEMLARRVLLLCCHLALSLLGHGASACPNPDLNAAVQVRSNGAALRMGLSRRVWAGGTASLADCGQVGMTESGAMTFPDAPSFSANLGGMLGLAIEIDADSRCPVGLLVQTADGTFYFDADGGGPGQPRMILRHPGRGTMLIWVGTADPQPCRTTLRLTTYAG